MDVDMGSGDGHSPSSHHHETTPPQSPASTRASSVIPLDSNPNLTSVSGDDESSVVEEAKPIGVVPAPAPPPIAGGNDNNNNNNNINDNQTSQPAAPASKPASTATSAKPRSSKPKARTPSPSPPPPPPPAPLQTIRLDIKLGGPDNYAVDVAELARASGQRPPTPVRVVSVTEHSETEEDEEHKGKTKIKKKRKNPAYEHYDVTDPFIDDSELAIDERTYFAQTKQQGFYVSSGEVALLKDKTPKKPKSKLNPLLASAKQGALSLSLAGTSKKPLVAVKSEAPGTATGAGTRELPLAVPSGSASEEESKVAPGAGAYTVGDPRVGEKRKRYVTVVEGGKKRKIVDLQSFHPLIQEEVEKLKVLIAKENWDQKGKFPPALKPPLAQLAVLAIKLDEYDEHFFNLMPTLFPYNKFTMSKLIKRTVFQEHTALLMERQEALLAELAEQAKAGFAKAEEEWEKAVLAWDKRQEKLRLEGAAGAGTDSTGPTRDPTEEMDVDASPSASVSAADKDKDKDKDKEGKEVKEVHPQQPPGKKYRLTESMKAIVWQLVLLSNECCRLENEKNTLEGSVIQVSEQGLRKALYQKIVAAFPEGWLSSGQISRDVSSMKKRFEKEAMENEHEQDF
ncbi:putative HPC2 and ubinuclein domain containing protein [Lyophyllum shimeji]|uniref:HPC2 and ubinuclein domain containing protein n=1 Tax=Lyophyllum shimeji TaxID=47721 RepID=A0A9P3PZG7_LYOSH|nr:putative HPC2 and ubinuclein domain containing protein [Lyophyllum shimeji]